MITTSRSKFTAVGFAALMSFGASAIAGDVMPHLSIAYFNGACPDGWSNTSLSTAAGRTLLPTPLGGGAGGFIGEALGSQQAPSHAHAKADGSISIPDKDFILIDGCCNDNLGAAGTRPMEGSATVDHSGFPYIQYNACLKDEQPEAGTVPSGVMAYSLIPCGPGFSEYNAAAGRYVVGLNPNGQPAATFGGANLGPSEIRTHTHGMDGSINLPGHEIAGGSGCCASGYAASGTHSFTGETVVDSEASKYDSAVQAPYYTAFLCEAN